MPINVEILDHTRSALPPKRFFIAAAAETLRIVRRESRSNARWEASLTVSFVNSRSIRAMNRRARGIDAATDILSFPIHEPLSASASRRRFSVLGKIDPRRDPAGVVRLGEIVIAPVKAAKGAGEFGHDAGEHLIFLFIHGLLHLLGYDHETSAQDARKMASLQDDIFSRAARSV